MSGYNGDLLNGGDVGGGAGSPYSQPVTLTLTGLTVGDNYNFLVYVAGGYSNLTYGMFALSGGPTYYLQTPNGDGVLGGPTVFQNNSTITDVWGPQPAGTPLTETLISNYVSFSGITATSASETITATELGTFSFGQWAPQPNANNYYNSFGISGVQVIDNGPAVPEPSTWAMMLGGLGMLLTGQRIRRSRKS